MIVLGYAHHGEDDLSVRRLSDGASFSNGERPDGLLVSRLDFDVQLLPIPKVPANEIDGLIRYRLRSIYPVDPAHTVFDYRIESDNGQRMAVVFIARKGALETCKALAKQRPMCLPYVLIKPIARARGNVRVWFWLPSWVEASAFRAGHLVSSAVFRGEDGSPDIDRIMQSEPAAAAGLPLVVIAGGDAADHLRRKVAGMQAQVISFQEFQASVRRIDGLFREKKRTPALLSSTARMAGLSLVVALLATAVLFKRVRVLENHAETLARSCSVLENQSQTTIALQKEVERLRSERDRLHSARPQDLYLFLSELAAVVEGDIQIRTLQVQGDCFQIEAVGSNPLKLMERFRHNDLFEAVKLSQAVPEQGSGREKFAFSGVFHAR